MIRIMSELPPHVVGFEGLGKVTVRDYETVIIPEINRWQRKARRCSVIDGEYHFIRNPGTAEQVFLRRIQSSRGRAHGTPDSRSWPPISQ